MAGRARWKARSNSSTTARAVKAAGATILRGGAFKPRTSPYEFQGLGKEGLRLLRLAKQETGLKIVTELLSEHDADAVAETADILQIGARNAQNFRLLVAAARTGKPILLKRGLSQRIEEWLLGAEYILSSGNPNVMLCERGIRTFETYTRNTLDLAAVAAAKSESHLPVIVDPSQGCGRADLVPALCAGAVAMGADGLIIEVHPNPAEALSDGQQQVDFALFGKLMAGLQPFLHAAGRDGSLKRSAPAQPVEQHAAQQEENHVRQPDQQFGVHVGLLAEGVHHDDDEEIRQRHEQAQRRSRPSFPAVAR